MILLSNRQVAVRKNSQNREDSSHRPKTAFLCPVRFSPTIRGGLEPKGRRSLSDLQKAVSWSRQLGEEPQGCYETKEVASRQALYLMCEGNRMNWVPPPQSTNKYWAKTRKRHPKKLIVSLPHQRSSRYLHCRYPARPHKLLADQPIVIRLGRKLRFWGYFGPFSGRRWVLNATDLSKDYELRRWVEGPTKSACYQRFVGGDKLEIIRAVLNLRPRSPLRISLRTLKIIINPNSTCLFGKRTVRI